MKLYYVDKNELKIFVITNCYQNRNLIEDIKNIERDEPIYIPMDKFGRSHTEGILNKNVFKTYKKAETVLIEIISNKIKELSEFLYMKNFVISEEK